jgi:hypothetical protein
MKVQKVLGAMVVAILIALCLVSTSSTTLAQSTAQQADVKEDETNLETQLYLIVGTNQAVADDKLPSSLDQVVKQLRATLPFKNYRLAATLINRVKNEGRLSLTFIGGPMANAGPSSPSNPSFSQFNVRQLRLSRTASGESVVQMVGFNFGTRVPIVTGSVAGNGAFPSINYENTGLQTDISIREGEPVVVGTLNVGPSGDAIILVVAAKRTSR